jgi:molybdopterin-guanine dinucleotide biosynthesis protein A
MRHSPAPKSFAHSDGTSPTTVPKGDVPAAVRIAAIVLAGGRGSRLGGFDKSAVEVDGRPLLDHVLDAVRGCAPVIVVGPPGIVRPGVTTVREDPPFGGPVAAIAAALDALAPTLPGAPAPPAETWLLACDLPRADRIVELLEHEPIGEAAGVVLADAEGREQWLAGRYRTAALRDALAGLSRVDGASMRRLWARNPPRLVPDRDGAALDLDTWPAIEHYRSMTDSPADLDDWVTELAEALGLDAPAVPVGLLLDLTRDAAHGVARPAGPLTTYLVGLAVAGGMPPEAAASVTRAAIERRAG